MSSLEVTSGSSVSSAVMWNATVNFAFEDLWLHGRTGSVYRARDMRSGALVTLKLLPFQLRKTSARKAFEKRARALGKICFPGVPKCLDFGYHFGLAYIVTEQATGATVQEIIDLRGPMDVDVFSSIFVALLETLEAVHAQGLIHGDVQANHIVLSDDGSSLDGLQLVGFGFPDLANSDATLSEDTTHVSNINAIAPERVLRQEIDHRLDLYAAGATAYHMLSGVEPFRSGGSHEVFSAVLEAPQPLAEILPRGHGVPGEVIELIEELLEKSPADRPQSATEVLSRFKDSIARPALRIDERAIPRLSDSESRVLEHRRDVTAALPQRVEPHKASYLGAQIPELKEKISNGSDSEAGNSLTLRQSMQVIGLVTVFMLFVAAGWFAVMLTAGTSDTTPAASSDDGVAAVVGEPQERTQEDVRDEINSLMNQISSALEEQRFGTAESLIGRLERRSDFPPELRGTLRAYESRLELASGLERARRLEVSGKVEDAMLIYLEIAEKFPNHAEIPEVIKEIEEGFVLRVDANVKGVVSIDGEPVGITPFVGVFPSNTKEVSVARTGYRSWSTMVSAGAGTQLKVDAELKKRPKREKRDRAESSLDASPFMDLMEMSVD